MQKINQATGGIKPNVEFEFTANATVEIKTTRAIQKGEQLLADYGEGCVYKSHTTRARCRIESMGNA